MFPTLVTGNMEKYVERAKDFLPERWMKGTTESQLRLHPYASLPYGHGARMCLGRRFADLEMQILFAKVQHLNILKLEKCRITSFANTFAPMTSKNWNSLPASIFPSTYNLQTFKTLKGAQTPTPSPSHLINFPFSSVMQGSFEIHRGCILLVRPFLHSISLEKKNLLTSV